MDKVRLIPLQRAELEDHLALQGLVYEHLTRHTGQLLGAGALNSLQGGLLSHPSPVVDNLERVSFSSFAFCQIQKGLDLAPNATRTPTAQVARFDSGVTGHTNHPLDLSATVAGSIYSIYAKATTIETDTAPRRQFSLVTGQEAPISMETRQRERIEFSLLINTSAPSSTTGVKILEFTVSTNRVFTFTAFSLWDETSDKVSQRLNNPSPPEAMLETSSLLDQNPRLNSNTLGLNEVLGLIRGQLARIIHAGQDQTSPIPSGTSQRWYDSPVQSIATLASGISTLASDILSNTTLIQGNTSEIQQLQKIAYFVYSVHIRYDTTNNVVLGVGESYVRPDGLTSSDFTVTFDASENSSTYAGQGAITDQNDLFRYFSYPVLQFGNSAYNDAEVLQCSVAPNVGGRLQQHRNSMVTFPTNTQPPEETPVNLPWAFRAKTAPYLQTSDMTKVTAKAYTTIDGTSTTSSNVQLALNMENKVLVGTTYFLSYTIMLTVKKP